MKKNKSVIILSGTALGSVLSLCKSASLNGYKVFVICNDINYCKCYQLSEYVNQVYQASKSSLYSVCCNICNQEDIKGKPLLYSTADIYCIWIDKQRSDFDEMVDLCIPSHEIISNFCYKDNANTAAKRNGLLVPNSIIIQSESDILTIEECFKFPVIIKPISVEAVQSLGSKYQLLEKDEYTVWKRDILEQNYGNLICQEYIPGIDNSYLFYLFFRDENGNISECMGEKTVQTNGIMAIGTTKYDKELAEISRSFLQKINYIGIGGLEFKKDKNQYYFIEMSTRTEGFLQISDMAGVSCADASFQWYTYRNNDYKDKVQRENIKYIAVIKLIIKAVRTKNITLILKGFYNILFDKKCYTSEFYTEFRPCRMVIKQLIKKKLFFVK